MTSKEDKIGLIKSEIYDAKHNYENLKDKDEIYPIYFSNRLKILEAIKKDLEQLDKLEKAMEIIIKEKIKPSAFIGMTRLWKNNYGEEMPFEEAILQLDFNGTKEEYENLKEVLYEQRIIRK